LPTCDDDISNYQHTDCPVRNAYASSTHYHNGSGGDATAEFSTSDSDGRELSIAYDLASHGVWVSDVEFGEGESSGFAYLDASLSFRRTAWFWYEGDILNNYGSDKELQERVAVRLNMPGGVNFLHNVADNLGASWAESGVLEDEGDVSLDGWAEVFAFADDPADMDVYGSTDYAYATAFAKVCIVECLADWNRDHTVNTQDYIAFLNDWNGSASDADLNGDGFVNSQDFTIFLNAHAVGNCTNICD
jgi:hypothetical protein